MFTPDQVAALQAPLDRALVKTREQGGKTLSYVEAWHAIAEANRIFGFDGWSRETVSLVETNRELVTLKSKDGGTYQQWRVGYMAKVRITAGSVMREGTGFGSGMGKPEALGDAVESAIKECESDAMKRALMTFGNPFGLALYDKTQANVVAAPPPISGACLMACDLLKSCKTPDELREFWTTNKDGLKRDLDPPEYAKCVEQMQAEAKRLAPAPVLVAAE